MLNDIFVKLFKPKSVNRKKNIIIEPIDPLLYSESKINLLLMIFIRIILVENYLEKNYWNNHFQIYSNTILF